MMLTPPFFTPPYYRRRPYTHNLSPNYPQQPKPLIHNPSPKIEKLPPPDPKPTKNHASTNRQSTTLQPNGHKPIPRRHSNYLPTLLPLQRRRPRRNAIHCPNSTTIKLKSPVETGLF